jgi:hypothetical protein
MRWYKVVKTINGRRYLYWQHTYREAGKVKTKNRYIGPFSGMLHHAYGDLQRRGGATVSILGDAPKRGFVYSPRKDTERVIPQSQFTEEDIDAYVDEMYNLLSLDDHYIGLWQYEEDIFLDIVKVVEDEQLAVTEAANAEQIAIHDLAAGQTKTIKDYSKTTYGTYLYKGENEGRGEARA